MEMPRQMSAGTDEQPRQRQQGDTTESRDMRDKKQQVAETPAEQMRATHFSDWASI